MMQKFVCAEWSVTNAFCSLHLNITAVSGGFKLERVTLAQLRSFSTRAYDHSALYTIHDILHSPFIHSNRFCTLKIIFIIN